MSSAKPPFVFHQRLNELDAAQLTAYRVSLTSEVQAVVVAVATAQGRLAEGRRGFWSGAAKAVGSFAFWAVPLILLPFDFGLTAALLAGVGGAVGADGIYEVVDQLRRNGDTSDEIAWAETNLARIALEIGNIDEYLRRHSPN